MSFLIGDNVREPGSRIRDSRILRPRDELQLIGSRFMAAVGVLDSHDPSAEGYSDLTVLLSRGGVPLLPEHHHILIRIEGNDEVFSTGMYAGVGEPHELIFSHITASQKEDPGYMDRLGVISNLLEQRDHHGLYFVSDNEQLSSTPSGREYVDANGGLAR